MSPSKESNRTTSIKKSPGKQINLKTLSKAKPPKDPNKDKKMNNKLSDDDAWVDIDLPEEMTKENKTGFKRSGVEVLVKAKVIPSKGTKGYASAASSVISPYVQTAIQSLSLHNQQKLPPKQRVYVHCVRHAQAHHNLRNLSSYTRKMLPDPRLTAHGIKQAIALAARFEFMDKLNVIVCSPLRRTIHTAYVGFRPAIFDRKVLLIAYPDLKEFGNAPSCTGVRMTELMKKFGELEGKVDTRLAPDGWYKNTELNIPNYKQVRAERVRKELYELGQIILKGGKGSWKGIEVKGVKKSQDVHILVVSHGAFLAALEGSEKERLYNAEYKTYEFATDVMIANGANSFDLVETAESKQYVHDPTVN
ncbi:histidine phosphatase superfamily [Rhexocercosporidium sp. MPI-PUGE-AT-0058]|nr:histidine phosphatase superfamily [Rhexocercosporidium sp. MPI-PUGE-AT-0058]